MEEPFDLLEKYQPDTEPGPRRRKPKLVRTQILYELPNHPHTKCEICGEMAFEKPFCIEHLDKMPYVRALKEELESE